MSSNMMSQFTDSIRTGQISTNGVAWGLTNTTAIPWVCYQQVGMFMDNFGMPIISINSIKIYDFCGREVPFTVSILAPECGIEQWTCFAPWQEGVCIENTFLRIAVLNSSVQIYINGIRMRNFTSIPTAGLNPNLNFNFCSNQYNLNGVNIYGRMNCIQDLYNLLSTTITCSLGLDCYWFHTEPNVEIDDTIKTRSTLPNIEGYYNNEDYIFHEYRFSHVTGIAQMRVLLPDNAYPSGKIEYDPFDIMFEKPFTVEVNRTIFAQNFGSEAIPLPTDYVFFPMLNRAYSVNEMYKKDEENFLYNNSMFTCELQMYSNDVNVDKSVTSPTVPIPSDIDNILGNYDDFFENGADIQANNSGFETTKMVSDFDFTNNNYEDKNRVNASDYEKIISLPLYHSNKQFVSFIGEIVSEHKWNETGEIWHKNYNVNTCNDREYYISIIYKKKVNELNKKAYTLDKNSGAEGEFTHSSKLQVKYKTSIVTIDTSELDEDVWYCAMVGVGQDGTMIPSLYRYNQREIDKKYPDIPLAKKHLKYKFVDTMSAVGIECGFDGSSVCDTIQLSAEYQNEILSYTNVLVARKPDIAPQTNSDVIFRDVLELANAPTR